MRLLVSSQSLVAMTHLQTTICLLPLPVPLVPTECMEASLPAAAAWSLDAVPAGTAFERRAESGGAERPAPRDKKAAGSAVSADLATICAGWRAMTLASALARQWTHVPGGRLVAPSFRMPRLDVLYYATGPGESALVLLGVGRFARNVVARPFLFCQESTRARSDGAEASVRKVNDIVKFGVRSAAPADPLVHVTQLAGHPLSCGVQTAQLDAEAAVATIVPAVAATAADTLATLATAPAAATASGHGAAPVAGGLGTPPRQRFVPPHVRRRNAAAATLMAAAAAEATTAAVKLYATTFVNAIGAALELEVDTSVIATALITAAVTSSTLRVRELWSASAMTDFHVTWSQSWHVCLQDQMLTLQERGVGPEDIVVIDAAGDRISPSSWHLNPHHFPLRLARKSQALLGVGLASLAEAASQHDRPPAYAPLFQSQPSVSAREGGRVRFTIEDEIVVVVRFSREQIRGTFLDDKDPDYNYIGEERHGRLRGFARRAAWTVCLASWRSSVRTSRHSSTSCCHGGWSFIFAGWALSFGKGPNKR